MAGKKGQVIDITRLSGPEKAAIVLLALGEDHKTLWEALDEEEIKELSQAMASLGTVSSTVIEELLVEFISGMGGTGAVMGSFEQIQRLLASLHAVRQGQQSDGGNPPCGPAGLRTTCRTSWPM